MAYHGIIWGLLSNDVGKAIRHTFVIEPGLEPWRPEANLADKTKATHTRHPMNPGTTMPSASQRWTTFQEPKSSLSPWKHACHRKNLFGIFFFLVLVFPLICESPLPTGFQLGSTLNWWRPTLTLTILSGDDSAAAGSTSAVDLSGRQRFNVLPSWKPVLSDFLSLWTVSVHAVDVTLSLVEHLGTNVMWRGRNSRFSTRIWLQILKEPPKTLQEMLKCCLT